MSRSRCRWLEVQLALQYPPLPLPLLKWLALPPLVLGSRLVGLTLQLLPFLPLSPWT